MTLVGAELLFNAKAMLLVMQLFWLIKHQSQSAVYGLPSGTMVCLNAGRYLVPIQKHGRSEVHSGA